MHCTRAFESKPRLEREMTETINETILDHFQQVKPMSTNEVNPANAINPINGALAPADQDAIFAAIGTIKQKLPFLIDLSKGQRKGMSRLGNKTHSFVKKALNVAAQNSGVLPATFDVNQMRSHTQLFEDLTPVKLAIDQLKKQLDDTVIGAGNQAYTAALDVYAVAKSRFGRAKLETAATELGQRFRGRKKAATASASSTPASSTPAAPKP